MKQAAWMLAGLISFSAFVFGFWRFVLPELKERAYQSFSENYEARDAHLKPALIDELKPSTTAGLNPETLHDWDDPSCGFLRTDHGLPSKDFLHEFFRRLVVEPDSSVAEFIVCPDKEPAPDTGDIVRKITLLSLNEEEQTAELEFALFGTSDGARVDYRNDSVRDTVKWMKTPWGLRLENSFPLGGHLYGVEQHIAYLKTKPHLTDEEKNMLQHFAEAKVEFTGF